MVGERGGNSADKKKKSVWEGGAEFILLKRRDRAKLQKEELLKEEDFEKLKAVIMGEGGTRTFLRSPN